MGKKISGGDIGLMIEPNPAYIKALVQKELIPTQKRVFVSVVSMWITAPRKPKKSNVSGSRII